MDEPEKNAKKIWKASSYLERDISAATTPEEGTPRFPTA
jgi:hypothetical protein